MQVCLPGMVTAAPFRPDEGTQAHLLHEPLHALVIDRPAAFTTQRHGNPSVAVAAAVPGIYGADTCFHVTLSVGALQQQPTLVVERATRQIRHAQQHSQSVVLPQSEDGTRLVGCADRFARTKACNFFR